MRSIGNFAVTGATITLESKEEVQKLQALLAAVPVNTADDFFDNLAESLEADLGGEVIEYVGDENGEFGPAKEDEGGCGCGTPTLSSTVKRRMTSSNDL